MRRSNWVKNKKDERIRIGQRWELLDEYKKIPSHKIHIIDIISIFKSSCDVRNVINHAHIGNYYKEQIMKEYKLVNKKPILKSNGKVRQIDLTQS